MLLVVVEDTNLRSVAKYLGGLFEGSVLGTKLFVFFFGEIYSWRKNVI